MATPNPFSKLYLGEILSKSSEYVRLFSDKIVPHADILFSNSNVILKGYQGMGKSMLLSLLSPQVRASFYHEKRVLPEAVQHFFFSAEINLTKSGIIEIGQRKARPEFDEEQHIEYSCAMFEDYFNYRTLLSLLINLNFMKESSNFDCFRDSFNPIYLDEFAHKLSVEDCFLGYFKAVKTMEQLIGAVRKRLICYQAFFQFNIDVLPDDVQTTKTSIGTPLEAAQRLLNKTKCSSTEAALYINVDQYEILGSLQQGLGNHFKELIHKVLSSRRAGVFYKIGTRLYGWDKTPRIKGTNLILEKERDFKEIDLSEVMYRAENSSSHIFPAFAMDVFERRLQYFAFEKEEKAPSLRIMFGQGYTVQELENIYGNRENTWNRAFPYPDDYPDAWKQFVCETQQNQGILEAKLVFAWSLQKNMSKGKISNYLACINPNDITNPQKDAWKKPYWRKERIQQAWMQLAPSNGQRLAWAGEQDIFQLSGNSILIFLSICQHIWDLRDRVETRQGKTYNAGDPISPQIQTIAIYNTSKSWFEKILERPNGACKSAFIQECARFLREQLRSDLSMSYPGSVGFSLQKINTTTDLDNSQQLTIRRFLEECADDELVMLIPHTSKYAKKIKQEKVYLNPIFSPYLQLPEKHVKEPYYASTKDFMKWWGKYQPPVILSSFVKRRNQRQNLDDAQPFLFDCDNL